jgi:hypothetical protein
MEWLEPWVGHARGKGRVKYWRKEYMQEVRRNNWLKK